MKTVVYLLTSVAMALAAAAVNAQHVKGNEAVTVLPNGSRKVETPPLPSASLAQPCRADVPACAAGGWRMVETDQGLSECTEIYARAGTCRASTYGHEKRPRVWIVKLRGAWMQCPLPEAGSKCVSTKALPTSVIQ